jgi:hypothetical protein
MNFSESSFDSILRNRFKTMVNTEIPWSRKNDPGVTGAIRHGATQGLKRLDVVGGGSVRELFEK